MNHLHYKTVAAAEPESRRGAQRIARHIALLAVRAVVAKTDQPRLGVQRKFPIQAAHHHARNAMTHQT